MEIRLEHVYKKFPPRDKKEKETVAVEDFTTTIKDGELVGLLGPSGCGKSTTLYLIAGLKDISDGKIYFDDQDVTDFPAEKRGIGLVFQNYALYPHMTVYQNIEFPLENVKVSSFKKNQRLEDLHIELDILEDYTTLSRLISSSAFEGKINKEDAIIAIIDHYKIPYNMGKKIIRIYMNYRNNEEKYEEEKQKISKEINSIYDKAETSKYSYNDKYEYIDSLGNKIPELRKLTKDERDVLVRETARLVQIDKLLERKPDALSGGQQQRVAIARALVKKPKVLLLDEPLSNLDARLRLQTREEIRNLQRRVNITTIFVTHDQEEAMSICDRIIVMENGRIVEENRPQDVYKNPSTLFGAKFLGNPPINIFKGKIQKNALYIGKYKLLNFEVNMDSKDVYVGVRPEAFIPTTKSKSAFVMEVDNVQTMGRDIMLVCKSDFVEGDFCKLIIGEELEFPDNKFYSTINLNKIFVFDALSLERIKY